MTGRSARDKPNSGPGRRGPPNSFLSPANCWRKSVLEWPFRRHWIGVGWRRLRRGQSRRSRHWRVKMSRGKGVETGREGAVGMSQVYAPYARMRLRPPFFGPQTRFSDFGRCRFWIIFDVIPRWNRGDFFGFGGGTGGTSGEQRSHGGEDRA